MPQKDSHEFMEDHIELQLEDQKDIRRIKTKGKGGKKYKPRKEQSTFENKQSIVNVHRKDIYYKNQRAACYVFFKIDFQHGHPPWLKQIFNTKQKQQNTKFQKINNINK